MALQALFIITGDPRQSAKPAEAIRIAAGVGTWKKADVIVYLAGDAILALSEYVDELKDEDNFTRYLPILRDFKHPIYVEAGAPALQELGEPSHPFKEIDAKQLGAWQRSQITSSASNMKKILHIIIKQDQLSEKILAEEKAVTGTDHKIILLPEGAPNYDTMLQEVFELDSIHVWS